MVLEILHRAFVLLGRSLAAKYAEIFSFSRSRIFFARVQPILPGLQFPNHKRFPWPFSPPDNRKALETRAR
jgi:hypothetical protein